MAAATLPFSECDSLQVHAIHDMRASDPGRARDLYPSYTQLLQHTRHQSVVRLLLQQSACMLRRSGLPELAATAAAMQPQDVPAWPQVRLWRVSAGADMPMAPAPGTAGKHAGPVLLACMTGTTRWRL